MSHQHKYIARLSSAIQYINTSVFLFLFFYFIFLIVKRILLYAHRQQKGCRSSQEARAFCRIKTVPRRQYIVFSVSELDEWEWMAKRLAILDKASFAVIPQPPYASTTRGIHIQPLSTQPKALFSNFTCSPTAAEAPEV